MVKKGKAFSGKDEVTSRATRKQKLEKNEKCATVKCYVETIFSFLDLVLIYKCS